MRAILAGGGTGGHVIPALAIANELKKSYGAEVLFIGTARGIENRLVPAAGYPLQLVRVGALKNVSLMTRARTACDLPRAVWDAGRMLNEFAPDVVIGVGGYASGPTMLAAVVKHIPTLAFEPNVVPGFANRVVARLVSAAAVHFEETAKYFRHAAVTGVPVRQAFFDVGVRPRDGTRTLLVFGRRQGFTSSTRPVSVTTMTRWPPMTGWATRLRFSTLLRICRRHLHARIWSSAGRARARWRKLRRRGSPRFLCRSRGQRTIING